MHLINRRKLMELLDVKSPVTIDSMERRGLLPARIRTSQNRVQWDLDAVEEMLRSRPTGIGAEIRSETA